MSQSTVDTKLAQFLFSYRSTPPHSTELMFGRRLRTRFDLLQPDTGERVGRKQEKQKEYFDRKARQREFALNEDVYVRNFSSNSLKKWIPGKITKLNGSVSYTVQLGSSRVCLRRHQNHLRKRLLERIPELEVSLSAQVVPIPSSAPTTTEPWYPQRPPIQFSEEL